jgi:FkbM family methyltransferase
MSLRDAPQAARRAADRIGLLPAVRQARQELQRSFGSADVRQSWRDNQNLALLLCFALPADANCLTIGSDVGGILETITHYCPQGRHVTYQPVKEMADVIVAAYPGIDVRRVAAGDHAGTATYRMVPTGSARAPMRRTTDPDAPGAVDVQVPLARLDDVWPEGYRADFVKVDVEGAELEILAGAAGMLAEHRPITVFDHGRGGPRYYDSDPHALHALLAGQLGFRIFDLDGRGPYTASELAAAYQAKRPFNFVART